MKPRSLGTSLSQLETYPIALLHACMLSHFSRAGLFVTLWTVAHKAPLSMGFSRQEYWSGLPCHFPGELPNSGIELTSPMSPASQADTLPSEPPGKPHPIPLYPTVNIVTNSQQKTSMVNPPI